MLPVLVNIKMDLGIFRFFALFEIKARYLDSNLITLNVLIFDFKNFGQLFFFSDFGHFSNTVGKEIHFVFDLALVDFNSFSIKFEVINSRHIEICLEVKPGVAVLLNH